VVEDSDQAQVHNKNTVVDKSMVVIETKLAMNKLTLVFSKILI